MANLCQIVRCLDYVLYSVSDGSILRVFGSSALKMRFAGVRI